MEFRIPPCFRPSHGTLRTAQITKVTWKKMARQKSIVTCCMSQISLKSARPKIHSVRTDRKSIVRYSIYCTVRTTSAQKITKKLHSWKKNKRAKNLILGVTGHQWALRNTHQWALYNTWCCTLTRPRLSSSYAAPIVRVDHVALNWHGTRPCCPDS